jgi:hypothetical protein
VSQGSCLACALLACAAFTACVSPPPSPFAAVQPLPTQPLAVQPVATAPDHEPPAAIPPETWLELPPDHPALERFRTEHRQVARVVGDVPADEGVVGEGKNVALLPDPEYPTRQRKRMNIDQLDDSFQVVSGGLTWTVGGKNQFSALSSTLGKPDFADMVIEDLTPSTLFEKFLQDAALNVCEALVAKDAKAKPADRVFFVHAEPTSTVAKDAAAVDKNLAYLLLRWHGRQVPPGSPLLENWRFLLSGVQKSAASPQAGWQAVCVGLATHPAFYTY